MKKQIHNIVLKDILEDSDFCEWALTNRPDLEEHYRQIMEEHPEKKELYERAYLIVNSLDDKKVIVDITRKKEIWESVQSDYSRFLRSMRFRRILKYAAILIPVIMIVSVSLFYTLRDRYDQFSSYDRQDFIDTKLLLNDGREINISEKQSEINYKGEGLTIEINEQQIVKSEHKRNASMDQLLVPFGRSSKIILADNTIVWINAGSRLIFPSFFSDKKRVVHLEGEAYFEVAKDKSKPFIVETNQSKIEVLGTRFNIKAYPDETIEETVLAEGSVSLEFRKSYSDKKIILEPKDRIVFKGTTNTFSVSKVNVEDYISWIDGMFIFHDEPLPTVLKRISAYYNIKIDWSKNSEARLISGKLDLKNEYEKVLDALALILGGNYIKDDKIIHFYINE